MKKNLFAKILIPILALGILITPISPVFKVESGKIAKINKAEAKDLLFKNPEIDISNIHSKSVTITVKITALATANIPAELQYAYDSLQGKGDPSKGVYFSIIKAKENDTNPFSKENVDLESNNYSTYTLASFGAKLDTSTNENTISINTPDFLDPETHYAIGVSIWDVDATMWKWPWQAFTVPEAKKVWVPFTTLKTGDPNDASNGTGSIVTVASNDQNIRPPLDLDCSLTGTGRGDYLDGIVGCFAGLFYVIWEITGWIARLAGNFLDFFVYYSTNSSSYTSDFISKGWGVIRDVANIFFIIALLYIAIKTILGLNVSNNKKLIGTIVIVALLINFSLFFTQVIIDGSNILAKVFYNQIQSIDEDGNPITADSPNYGGYKSVSVSLVSAFDPQQLISSQAQYDASRGTFIFITILLIFLTLYAAYMFAVVAVLFVGRVVSLWIAMIFGPLAFASYTVSFEMPFGHKEWWKNLLENAFLAPLFIFFLYIILMFAEINKTITYLVYDKNDLSGQGLIISIMGTVIPFAIIFIMLMKAKEMAIKYSGELGKQFSKIGGIVAGGAVGLAAGALAMGGKRVIGGGGSYVANKLAARAEKSGNVKTAQRLRDFSKFAQKSSFDVRGVKVAGKTIGSASGLKVGKAQEGGWAELKKKQNEKKTKRAEELKKSGTGKEKKDLDNAEIALKEAVLTNFTDASGLTLPIKLHLEKFDKEMDKARKDLSDAKASDPDDGSAASAAAKAEMARAKAQLDAAKAGKEALRTMGGANSIKALEQNKNKAAGNLEVKEDQIVTNYAKKISSKKNKVKNVLFRVGGYSVSGADETARNLRSGKKVDSGEKPH